MLVGMRYFAYPENTMVPSGVTTGSMTVDRMPKLIQLHAVAAEDDGTVSDRTVRGSLLARFDPEEVEHQPWEATHVYKRCMACAKATGFFAANEYTGEMVQGRMN